MISQRAHECLGKRLGTAMRTVVFVAGLISAAVPAAAQVNTFDLSGVIKDQQGGVLPGVSVTMRNEATGLTRTAITDTNGHYYFASLPPQGTWGLAAELIGFAPYKQVKLEFYADSTPVINITLRVGALQETVTVVQEAPLVETGQATLGMSINKEQIADLPLNGRSYMDMALLVPGVSDVGVDNPLGSQSQTINGAYSRYTSYVLDGFNNTRDQHGVEKTPIPVDAMSEFRVQTNQYSAEYGETVGGIVTVVTKSGTNSITGIGSAFIRLGNWDGPDPLTAVKAPQSRQDFAGLIGGPIVQNRTHYLVDVEHRNENDQSIVTASIANGAFKGTFPVGTTRPRVFVKVDHSVDSNNLFDVSFAAGRTTTTGGIGGLNVAQNLSTFLDDTNTLNGTYRRLFSNDLLNEFRLGYAHENDQTSTAPPTNGVALAYPGQANIGSSNTLQTTPDRSIQVADTFTLHTSRHTVKMGGNARSATPGGVLDTNLTGTYTFGPNAPYPYNPANPASYPIQFTQGFFGPGGSPSVVLNKWHYATFVQDDWRITDNLTLNLGLRYDVETLVPDHNNIGPRFGFAWDMTHDSKTVMRGGAGIFTGTVFSTIDAFEAFDSPVGFQTVTLSTGQPNFPQFPNILPGGPQLPAGVTPLPFNAYLPAPTYAPSMRKSPQSDNVTLGVDRQLGSTVSMSVDFQYNRGYDLLVPADVNAPSYFDYSTGLTRTAAAANASRPFGYPGHPIAAGALSYLPNGAPFSDFRQLLLIESAGISHYAGVSVRVDKRFSQNFSLQSQYTWSHATNNGDGFRASALPNNPNDRNAEWGISDTNVPNSFSLNGVYRLPWDFQVSAIARAHTGTPVNPMVGLDLTGDGNLLERPFANGVILGRNSFTAPAFFELDMGFGKSVKIGRGRVEARFEGFNLTNHLNPSAVNSTYGANANAPLPTFLKVNSDLFGRQYQLAFKVVL
jgi:hypothetical protein